MADILDKNENTTPVAGDKLYIVDDPAGTPADEHITVENLIAFGDDRTATLTGKTIDADNNTITNIDIGNEAEWASIDDVTDASAFTTGDKVLIFEAGVGMRKVDYSDLPGSGGGLSNIVEDTTPKLGGSLDVNGNAIVSVSNGDIDITPNGTGKINLGNGATGSVDVTGDFTVEDNYGITFKPIGATGSTVIKTDETNFAISELVINSVDGTGTASDTIINFAKGFTIYSDTELDGSGSTYAPYISSTSGKLELAGDEGGVEIKTYAGTNTDITLAPDGTGSVIIDGLTYPSTDGTDGQVLTTDGAGNLAFESVSGGISNVVDDTTPKLGGNLDVNGSAIVSTSNGDIQLTPNGTGAVVITDSKGLETTYLRPNTAVSNTLQVTAGSSTAGGDLLLDSGAGTTGDGGDVQLRPGASTSGGANGQVAIVKPTTLQEMRIDNSALTANRTLTMPDANVNLANVNSALQNITGEALTNLSDVDTDKSKTPADGDVLTFDGTDWNAEAPAGGGGGNPYNADIVVASSGGDYTLLEDALEAVTTDGTIIYVEPGTYSEDGAVTCAYRVTIYGGGRDNTIIDLSTFTFEFNGNGTEIHNIQFIVGANANGKVVMDCDDYLVTDCKFFDNHGLGTTIGLTCENTGGQLIGNLFVSSTGFVGDFLQFNSSYGVCANNILKVVNISSGKAIIRSTGSNAVISGNQIFCTNNATGTYGIYGSGTGQSITGNTIRGVSTSIWYGTLWGTISANTTYGGERGIYISNANNTIVGNTLAPDTSVSAGIELNASSDGCSITGNTIRNVGTQAGTGILLASDVDKCIISANYVQNFTTGVSIPASTNDENIVTSNQLDQNTTPLSDSGTGTVSANNIV